MQSITTKQTAEPLTDRTDQKRLEKRVGELEALLERVLGAGIAQGCKTTHPRLALVYDIQAALEPGTGRSTSAHLVDEGTMDPDPPATPTWPDLARPVESLLAAYQDKYGRPASSGVRANAPLQHEVGNLRRALNDLRTGRYQAGRW